MNETDQLPPAATATIAVLATGVSMATLGSNIVVLIAFIVESSLRIPSNYFIASLAVTDLLIGLISMNLFITYQLLGRWPLGPIICDFWLSLDFSVCLTSQYTVFLITLDRYCSVKIPVSYRNWRTLNKVRMLICASWSIPALLFVPVIFGWRLITGDKARDADKCDVSFVYYPVFNTTLIICYFWVTLIVMCLLYAGIYKVARRLELKSQANSKRLAAFLNAFGPGATSKHNEEAGDVGRGGTPATLYPLPVKPISNQTTQYPAKTRVVPDNIMTIDRCEALSGDVSDDANRAMTSPLKTSEGLFDLNSLNSPIESTRQTDHRSKSGGFILASEEDGETTARSTSPISLANVSTSCFVPSPRIVTSDTSPPPRPSVESNQIRLVSGSSEQEDDAQSTDSPIWVEQSPVVGSTISRLSVKGFEKLHQFGLLDEESSFDELIQYKCQRPVGKPMLNGNGPTSHYLYNSPIRSTSSSRCSCSSQLDELYCGCQQQQNLASARAVICHKYSNRWPLLSTSNSSYSTYSSYSSNRSLSSSLASTISTSPRRRLFISTVSITRCLQRSVRCFRRRKSTPGRINSTPFSSRCRLRLRSLNLTLTPPTTTNTTTTSSAPTIVNSSGRDSKVFIRKNTVKFDAPLVDGNEDSNKRRPVKPTTTSRLLAARVSWLPEGAAFTSDRNNRRHARKALRTISLILGAFMMCWIPYHIVVMIKGFCDNKASKSSCINPHLYNLVYWLCYMNSPINPFCYALSNVSFKRTFFRILKGDIQRR